MRTLMGDVVHEVKVTRIKGRGWAVRVYTNGVVNQEQMATTQAEIALVARQMLRMEDKCGNISKFASAARHRPGLKALEASRGSV